MAKICSVKGDSIDLRFTGIKQKQKKKKHIHKAQIKRSKSMSYISKTEQIKATDLCKQFASSMLEYNDIIDIRKTRAHFNAYSFNMAGDIKIIIANNDTECKNYIKQNFGGFKWVQADTNNGYGLYRGLTCWAGTGYTRTGISHAVLYKLNKRVPCREFISLGLACSYDGLSAITHIKRQLESKNNINLKEEHNSG